MALSATIIFFAKNSFAESKRETDKLLVTYVEYFAVEGLTSVDLELIFVYLWSYRSYGERKPRWLGIVEQKSI